MLFQYLCFILFGLVSLTYSFSCPKEIRRHISYGSDSANEELPKIYKTLISCPAIHTLDLRLSQGGCVAGDDPWCFDFSPRDRFPPLKHLSLHGYDFDNTRGRWRHRLSREHDISYSSWNFLADMTGVDSLRPKKQFLEPPSASNLDQWRSAMDWSQLESLKVADTNPRFLQKMMGRLPSLTSLTLGGDGTNERDEIINQTLRFLKASPPLSSLSLHGYTTSINWTDILPQHGDTLRALEIHEWESPNALEPTPALSLSQLQRVKDDCPLLEDLSVRLNRNGSWPYDVIDTLATFESLKKLQLWLELGMDKHQGEQFYYAPISHRKTGEDDYRQPRVNSSSALSLFHHLRAQKKGVELQQLVLYVGDFGRHYDGGMRFQDWGEGLEEIHECNIFSRDGHGESEGEAWCGRV